MEDYSKLKKEELIDALTERDNELLESKKTLDKAMVRLTQSESAEKVGPKITNIDGGKKGNYAFRGNGIRYQGKFYSADDLKNEPDVAVALFENGSELIKKTK